MRTYCIDCLVLSIGRTCWSLDNKSRVVLLYDGESIAVGFELHEEQLVKGNGSVRNSLNGG